MRIVDCWNWTNLNRGAGHLPVRNPDDLAVADRVVVADNPGLVLKSKCAWQQRFKSNAFRRCSRWMICTVEQHQQL